MKTEVINVLLTIKTPVHIGCGECYDPLSFYIDESNKQLVTFDNFELINNLTNSEVSKLNILGDDIIKYIEFFSEHKGKIPCKKTVSVPKVFPDDFKAGLKIKKYKQYEICRTAFLSDERPYIPGSSIKGAIRTAYLNFLDNQKNDNEKFNREKIIRENNPKQAAKRLEANILSYQLGDTSSDPFRLVKISDFIPVGDVKTEIVYAQDFKKKISERDASGPFQIIEAIRPGSKFVGTIKISFPEDKTIVDPIDMEGLFESISFFYGERRHSDLKNLHFYSKEIEPQKEPEEFFLQIGRHSGAEAVTIEDYRSIKVRLGRNNPKDLPHSTTIWMASDSKDKSNMSHLRFFSWAALKKISNDELKRYENDEVTFQVKINQEKDELLRKAQELDLRKKQEVEEGQKKQAAFDSLPHTVKELVTKLHEYKKTFKDRYKEAIKLPPAEQDLFFSFLADFFSNESNKPFFNTRDPNTVNIIKDVERRTNREILKK